MIVVLSFGFGGCSKSEQVEPSSPPADPQQNSPVHENYETQLLRDNTSNTSVSVIKKGLDITMEGGRMEGEQNVHAEYGRLLFETQQFTVQANRNLGIYFITNNGSPWLPPSGYSYTVEMIVHSNHLRPEFKLYGGTTPFNNRIRRIESNYSALQKDKHLFFSRSRFRNNKNAVVLGFHNELNNQPVNVSVRFYIQDLQYQEQSWVELHNYIHYNQQHFNNVSINACGPNSYMIARYMLRPTNSQYNVGYGTLYDIHNRLLGYQDYIDAQFATTITLLRDLAVADGVYSPNGLLLYGTGNGLSDFVLRSEFNQALVSAIGQGRIVLLPVMVQNGNIVETRTNAIGHYIILIGIERTADGINSRAYYKDGMTNESKTRVVNYTTLLNSIRENSHNQRNYNALVLQ